MARILIADSSDPEFSTALARVLALKGFGTVATACGSADALWLRVLAEPPDLLLVDGKSAAEILEKIRSTPRAQNVRVLVVSDDRNLAHALPGAHGYIQSPALPQAYVQAVRNVLTI
jgi:DNA-binding NarL/FixJ family response regulator